MFQIILAFALVVSGCDGVLKNDGARSLSPGMVLELSAALSQHGGEDEKSSFITNVLDNAYRSPYFRQSYTPSGPLVKIMEPMSGTPAMGGFQMPKESVYLSDVSKKSRASGLIVPVEDMILVNWSDYDGHFGLSGQPPSANRSELVEIDKNGFLVFSLGKEHINLTKGLEDGAITYDGTFAFKPDVFSDAEIYAFDWPNSTNNQINVDDDILLYNMTLPMLHNYITEVDNNAHISLDMNVDAELFNQNDLFVFEMLDNFDNMDLEWGDVGYRFWDEEEEEEYSEYENEEEEEDQIDDAEEDIFEENEDDSEEDTSCWWGKCKKLKKDHRGKPGRKDKKDKNRGHGHSHDGKGGHGHSHDGKKGHGHSHGGKKGHGHSHRGKKGH